MSQREIKVAMGEGVVTRAPHVISSLGLGSCVVIAIYDTRQRIGGLAHIMLPDSNCLSGQRPPFHCADTAIVTLLKKLRSKGAKRRDMVGKMVGGAQMFVSSNGSSPGIGVQNTTNIKQILDREEIPLTGEDIGDRYGRNVEFHLDSGKVIVKAIGREDRKL